MQIGTQLCVLELLRAVLKLRSAIILHNIHYAHFDAHILDPAWTGWRLAKGHLISPEGWELSMSDVLASRLHEDQLPAWRREVRVMKAQLAEMERGGYEDQPTIDSWDVLDQVRAIILNRSATRDSAITAPPSP